MIKLIKKQWIIIFFEIVEKFCPLANPRKWPETLFFQARFFRIKNVLWGDSSQGIICSYSVGWLATWLASLQFRQRLIRGSMHRGIRDSFCTFVLSP
jgi:hypothetical protein